MDKATKQKLEEFQQQARARKKARKEFDKMCRKMESMAKKSFKKKVKPVFKKYDKICKELGVRCASSLCTVDAFLLVLAIRVF